MRNARLFTVAARGLGSLLGLALALGAAYGQTPCSSAPLAGCPEPFKAVVRSPVTGALVEVTTFYVGCPITFVQNCGRNTPLNLLYYQVTRGANATPAGCLPTTAAGATTYTPTAADVGPVTVFELANPVSGGGAGQGFVRNYQVVATAPPPFTVAPCLNNTALVSVTDRVFDSYTLQVNGGAPQPLGGRQPLVVAVSSGAAATFTLTGTIANTGCSATNQQTVTLAAPQTPVLSRLTVVGPLPGSLVLEVGSLPAGYLYSVESAAPGSPGGFTVVATVAAGSTTVSLPAAPAGQYRLRRTDACGNAPAFSALLPTVVLSGASASNVNTLTWQAAGPVAGYTLLRNGTALTTLPASATSYADAAVACGTRYTYRLRATGASGGEVIANEVAVQTVSALAPPAPLLNASFDLRNRLTLTATLPGGAALPAGGQLVYGRQGGPAATEFPAVPAADTLRDPATLNALRAAPPCYTVRLLDVCGNGSATSPPTCPSLLSAEAADPESRTVRLSWSAFRGPGSPASAASYRVLTLAANGAVLAASAPTTALAYLDLLPPPDQLLRYRIEASGAGLPAGTASYSNVATLGRRPVWVVPNAFTPNGDGLNDVLELKGRYLSSFTFIVIDRNGQEVFRATDRRQTWDGTIQGRAPVNAAYVWRLYSQDAAGQPLVLSGTVTILK